MGYTACLALCSRHGPDATEGGACGVIGLMQVAWLLANGFAGHLEKPIDIQEFPHQVRQYCSG